LFGSEPCQGDGKSTDFNKIFMVITATSAICTGLAAVLSLIAIRESRETQESLRTIYR